MNKQWGAFKSYIMHIYVLLCKAHGALKTVNDTIQTLKDCGQYLALFQILWLDCKYLQVGCSVYMLLMNIALVLMTRVQTNP